jgi:hypothetical protein
MAKMAKNGGKMAQKWREERITKMAGRKEWYTGLAGYLLI